MRIAVYTALYGNKDELISPLNYIKSSSIDYFLFTDSLDKTVFPYKTIYKEKEYSDIVKNSRKIKILNHDILKEYDVLVWHDANIQLKHDKLLDLIKNIGTSKILLFQHPDRNCVYGEAMACIRNDKDSYFKIIKQMLKYFIKGVPFSGGMMVTGLMVINNKANPEKFLNSWWKELDSNSRRDQLSLPYTIFRLKESVKVLNENIYNNGYSVYQKHLYKFYKGDNFKLTGNPIMRKGALFCIRGIRKVLVVREKMRNG